MDSWTITTFNPYSSPKIQRTKVYASDITFVLSSYSGDINYVIGIKLDTKES